MISLVFISALVAGCLAQYPYNPNQYAPQAPQHNSNSHNNPAPVHYVNIGAQLQGDYKFGYNTGNGNDGSFREETRNPDGSVSGAYGYVDASGKQKIIRYTAGKDGFKAEGDDIPKAPPAPAPVAPQAQYQPQPQYQAPAQQYQPQQYNQYNPQSNYVQPQPSQSYNQYSQPQQYNNNQNNNGAYNPFAYNNPQPGQAPQQNLLSYNIGGGQPSNHYQG